jgi:hypothetical protein
MPIFLDTSDEATYGIGLCDRCHRKFSLTALQSDVNFKGLKVCDDEGCRDVLDPYRLPAKTPDKINLPFRRPDEPMTYEED